LRQKDNPIIPLELFLVVLKRKKKDF